MFDAFSFTARFPKVMTLDNNTREPIFQVPVDLPCSQCLFFLGLREDDGLDLPVPGTLHNTTIFF
jgi:hypothetical protein